MSDRRTQSATQLANIERETAMTVADFTTAVRAAGLERHGEIVSMLKADHGLTHGNANLIAHLVREELSGGPAPDAELLDAQYRGAKARLRPVLDDVVAAAEALGSDVEVRIQKSGVSLRRAKQFAVVRAASAKRVELGLNLGDLPATQRLIATSGMCDHRVDLSGPDEVDDEVRGWLEAAYERAG